MTAPIQQTILNNTFWLSPERCIFWEEENTLILADLHFGKTGHFRKNGIAIPQPAFLEDLQRLLTLISHCKPQKIIAVGDLFHSKANKEHELFAKWRNDFNQIEFVLVKGNHDILTSHWYEETGIVVHHSYYTIGQFGFMHDPADVPDMPEDVSFVFSGHLHPGVRIQGLGKQSLRFPCYYFTKNQAILPAFSHFSGLSLLKKQKSNQIYAIVNQSLVLIQ